MNRKQMHVVYITDENYAMTTGVSLLSLVDSFAERENLVVHIITVGVNEKERSRWEEIASDKVKLDIIDKTEAIEGIKDNVYQYGYVTPVSILKFNVPEMLHDVNKCLYLDGDIIVNADISTMFDIDLEGFYVAAVRDMGDVKDEEGRSEFAKKINLNDENYFNSGVMLLNLSLMREHNISGKLLDYRINGKNFFMDQDALNYVLGKKKKLLPFQYNFLTTIFDYMDFDELNRVFFDDEFASAGECCHMQKILHMTGRFKAWKYCIPYITDIFLGYYERSPYNGQKLELKSPILFLNNKLKEMERKKEWKFPYKKILPHSKVIIYGAGKVGESFIKQLEMNGYCDVVLWCDKFYSTKDERVVSPQEINKYKYDYVLITAQKDNDCQAIREELVKQGVLQDRIVFWF